MIHERPSSCKALHAAGHRCAGGRAVLEYPCKSVESVALFACAHWPEWKNAKTPRISRVFTDQILAPFFLHESSRVSICARVDQQRNKKVADFTDRHGSSLNSDPWNPRRLAG
jgi:hypothetical protein